MPLHVGKRALACRKQPGLSSSPPRKTVRKKTLRQHQNASMSAYASAFPRPLRTARRGLRPLNPGPSFAPLSASYLTTGLVGF